MGKRTGIYTAYTVMMMAIALFGCGLCLVVLEMLPDSFFKQGEELGQRALALRELKPSTQFTVRPNPIQIADSDNLINRDYDLATDANGFVNPFAVHSNPDSKVLFLGGSTTLCAMMEPYQRFPYLVGRYLEEQFPGRQINTYNGGVAGNNSMNSLVLFLAKGIPLKPNIVVLMETINDFNALLRFGSYWKTQNPRPFLVQHAGFLGQNSPSREALKYLFTEWFPHTTILSRRVYTDWIRPLFQDPNTPTTGVAGGLFDPARVEREFEMSLRSFVSVARAWKITPVLMTQANRLTPNPDPVILGNIRRGERELGIPAKDLIELGERLTERVRLVSHELRVPLVDLNARIPRTRDYMYDIVHYTPKGSQSAAVEITQVLTPLLAGTLPEL